MKSTENSKKLSFRLNAKIISLHFANSLSIAILAAIVAFFAFIFYAEYSINAVIERFEDAGSDSILSMSYDERKPIDLGRVSVSYTDEEPEDIPFSRFFLNSFPDNTKNGLRSLSQDSSSTGFISGIRSLNYNVGLVMDSVPNQDSIDENLHNDESLSSTNENAEKIYYQIISVNIGEFIYYGFFVFAVVILLILLSMLTTGLQTRKAVKRTLEPLSNLRAATEAFADSAKTGTGAYSEDALRNLAGSLNSINAGHLDQRIPSEIVARELRPLAAAINEMIDRIDESYSSQIRFVSDASHELRTPIAVIQGYANLLLRWGANDPKILQESIDAIKSEADSMKQMVNQLLFLARGDTQSMKLDYAPLDLSKLAREVIKEEIMIDQAHVFESSIEDNVFVYADSGLIKQLFRILSDNSIKYSEPGGIISIKLERTPAENNDSENYFRYGRARLTVQDEGSGIPKNILPHIFDRFVRADESRTRNTGGAGLGLSIAKWIVEKNNGYIEVLSNEGLGTRFTVVLPIYQPNPNDINNDL